jgi:hypothetical protein
MWWAALASRAAMMSVSPRCAASIRTVRPARSVSTKLVAAWYLSTVTISTDAPLRRENKRKERKKEKEKEGRKKKERKKKRKKKKKEARGRESQVLLVSLPYLFYN